MQGLVDVGVGDGQDLLDVVDVGTSDELKAQIGGERVEIVLEGPADADAALSALSPICIDRPAVEGNVVRAPVRRYHGLIPEIVRALDDADVSIDDIALHRPTLDDVFMALTGHAAEEEPAQEEVPA